MWFVWFFCIINNQGGARNGNEFFSFNTHKFQSSIRLRDTHIWEYVRPIYHIINHMIIIKNKALFWQIFYLTVNWVMDWHCVGRSHRSINCSTTHFPPLKKGFKCFLTTMITPPPPLDYFPSEKSALTVKRIKYWQDLHCFKDKIIWVAPFLPSFMGIILPRETHWIVLI